MKYYHISKFKDEGEKLQIGQEFEFIKDKPNSFRSEILNFDGYYLDHIQGNTNYWETLSHIFNIDLNKVDEETKRRMRTSIEAYVYNEGLFRRESILEEVRLRDFSSRPSRYSCMWLTDEECIDSWVILLNAKENYYNVFEMELDGNLFCSTDELLPEKDDKIKDIYEEARKYWNPTKEELENSIKREYLFEGKARVKKIYR